MSSGNIVAIYPGHNGNICFYKRETNTIHTVEVEKLFGLKHARMESARWRPFAVECINSIEACVRALKWAKELWGIENDFDVVINGTRNGTILHEYLDPAIIQYVFKTKKVFNDTPHHQSHAYCAWRQSPFKDCYIITADGGGDDGVFWGFSIENDGALHKKWSFPACNIGRNLNMLGSFVNECSIGTKNRMDIPGKIMGLSAYGIPDRKIINEIKRIIRNNGLNNSLWTYRQRWSKGQHELTDDVMEDMARLKKVAPYVDHQLIYVNEFLKRQPFVVKRQQLDIWWDELGREDPITPKHSAHIDGENGQNFARCLQEATEELICEKIIEHREEIVTKYGGRLCFVGGVALNVLTNERIKNQFPEIELYVPPNPNDSGLAFGLISQFLTREGNVEKYNITYSGLPIQDAELADERSYITITSDDLAAMLRNGKIVGLIQGNSEVGPRALGNRSIICDPSYPDMKDILNAKVKFREWYRPFAPVCRREDVDKYFMSRDFKHMQYMGFAVVTKEEYREQLKAVTHVDNTARVQTVEKEQNEFLYELLGKHGGVLLNTSFNVQGKPILNTLEEAFWVLDNSGLDHVVFKKNNELRLYGEK